MNRTNISRIFSVLFLFGVSTAAFSASTDPIFIVGGVGSYSQYKLDGDGVDADDKSHFAKGGVFANFGNKMTSANGFVYQLELQGQYGEKRNDEVRDLQADLDFGLRAAIDSINSLDIIIGGGYNWSRLEPDADDLDVKLTTRSPFAKAAIGYNHRFTDATLRAEIGARRSINADGHVKISQYTSDGVDLKDKTSPYIELGLLLNQNGKLPLYLGSYLTYTEYDSNDIASLGDDVKLKRGEAGLKVGLAF